MPGSAPEPEVGGDRAPGLRDHWQWRPEWALDRPCLYWYLAVDDDQLARTWDRLLAPLERQPWLDVVPPRWWHVTLCDVGFVDELDPATVDAVVGAVRHAVLEPLVATRAEGPGVAGPLRLACGPLELFRSAIAVRACPVDVLRALQGAVRDCTQQVLGAGRPLVHRHEFRPHLSLAYANREVDPAELASLLHQLPDVPAQVEVDRCSLVAVTRLDRHYQWTVQHEVPLTPPAPPA